MDTWLHFFFFDDLLLCHGYCFTAHPCNWNLGCNYFNTSHSSQLFPRGYEDTRHPDCWTFKGWKHEAEDAEMCEGNLALGLQSLFAGLTGEEQHHLESKYTVLRWMQLKIGPKRYLLTLICQRWTSEMFAGSSLWRCFCVAGCDGRDGFFFFYSQSPGATMRWVVKGMEVSLSHFTNPSRPPLLFLLPPFFLLLHTSLTHQVKTSLWVSSSVHQCRIVLVGLQLLFWWHQSEFYQPKAAGAAWGFCCCRKKKLIPPSISAPSVILYSSHLHHSLVSLATSTSPPPLSPSHGSLLSQKKLVPQISGLCRWAIIPGEEQEAVSFQRVAGVPTVGDGSSGGLVH